MINLKRVNLIFLITILFASCNKDEDIIINDPQQPDYANSIFSVIEYMPAPGQFINDKASGLEKIYSMEQACEMAQKRLDENSFVSLGAWGGYITVKFKQSIYNKGSYDFSIAGNSFDSSNEPGIVWVMSDDNNNGLADDEWYELKGSYFNKEGYERNYWVEYYRPEKAGMDTRWTDSKGNTGIVEWVGTFHSQDFYYPEWVNAPSYRLYGSLLPDKTVFDEETGQWKNLPYDWGYADNNGEDSQIVEINGKTLQKNYFRISDAVDKEGKQINLKSIDFIRVQTAVNGKASILGENSTEICGFFIENN